MVITKQLTKRPEGQARLEILPRKAARQTPDVHQARILILDDESLNIAVVQSYLELDGYQNIKSTDDSSQALSLLYEFRPDLVLLDIHMPNVDGMQILNAIRDDDD